MDKMTYKRKVDKAEIPICNIMGVNIAAINMKWLLYYLEKNLSNLKGDYICVSNVHTTVMSYEESSYCAIQNGGIALDFIHSDRSIFKIVDLDEAWAFLNVAQPIP